jgi:hypothetical protein
MLGGKIESYTVVDLLENDYNGDGVWNLGERVVFPIEYDFDYSIHTDVDISIVDFGSSALLMD